MKKVGLIGGMSWESTQIYYREINRAVRARCGGLTSARLMIDSLEFAAIAEKQASGDWDQLGEQLAESALGLQGAGCDVIALATNTMHKVAPAIEAAIDVPFCHITDALVPALKSYDESLLLATAFTMEQDFVVQRLRDQGCSVQIPDATARAEVHRIIFEELCQGQVVPSSRQFLLDLIADAKHNNAQSVVLGCTELCMAVDDVSSSLPVLDTTSLHIDSIVQRMLDV